MNRDAGVPLWGWACCCGLALLALIGATLGVTSATLSRVNSLPTSGTVYRSHVLYDFASLGYGVEGVVIGPDGAMYVTTALTFGAAVNDTRPVWRFEADHHTPTRYAELPTTYGCSGCDFDQHGNLYVVCNTGSPATGTGKLVKIGPGASSIDLNFVSRAASQFSGVVSDRRALLYLTDRLNDVIYTVNASGSLAVWSNDTQFATPVPFGLNDININPIEPAIYTVVTVFPPPAHSKLLRVAIESDGSAAAAQTVSFGSALADGFDGLSAVRNNRFLYFTASDLVASERASVIVYDTFSRETIVLIKESSSTLVPSDVVDGQFFGANQKFKDNFYVIDFFRTSAPTSGVIVYTPV